MIITQTCLRYMLFWKDQSLLVKNKPMKDSWDLVKQVSVFIIFVRLNKLQSSSSLLKPKPLTFRSMLKCWYFKMALLNDSDSSSKNIERLPGSGGLGILKPIAIYSSFFLDLPMSWNRSSQIYHITEYHHHHQENTVFAQSFLKFFTGNVPVVFWIHGNWYVNVLVSPPFSSLFWNNDDLSIVQ